MEKIITSGAKLNQFIALTVRQYETVSKRLHVAAISSIAFACVTGDIRPLNRLNAALRSNDHSALKLFIRRAHAVSGLNGKNPDGLESDIVNSAILAGSVIGFAKGEFTMLKGHNTVEAKRLAKLCERFINPSEKLGDRMVFDRNNFAETKLLGDDEILKQIVKLAAQLDGKSDNRKVTVSNKINRFVKEFAGKAETMLEQLSLSETERKNATETRRVKAAKPTKAKGKVATVAAS